MVGSGGGCGEREKESVCAEGQAKCEHHASTHKQPHAQALARHTASRAHDIKAMFQTNRLARS
eukprot:2282298-Rhodomonas_salina.1